LNLPISAYFLFRLVLAPPPPNKRSPWAIGGPSNPASGDGRLIGHEARLLCLCALQSSSGRLFVPRFGVLGGVGLYSGRGYIKGGGWALQRGGVHPPCPAMAPPLGLHTSAVPTPLRGPLRSALPSASSRPTSGRPALCWPSVRYSTTQWMESSCRKNIPSCVSFSLFSKPCSNH